MKLTHYGIREWLGGGIIFILLIAGSVLFAVFVELLAGISLSVIFALSWFALAAFFRDPERVIPAGDGILVSPADGHVRDIELVSGSPENECFGGRNAIRVGIFLSVFDVHLNRAPCQVKVREKIYRKGRYHDARDPLASSENEAMTVVCDASACGKEFTLIVRQISGAIAKRIVCPVEAGSVFSKGEIYGMIKFGSRTELFFPAGSDFELKVKIGDRVHAGTSIMAEIQNKTE
jgi:phosphatidylserine decarboxylase